MIQAVIFDLDGVLVTTDDSHYEAWKQMADEEGIPFDRQINQRLRGVSRMESLEIILEKSERPYTQDEKRNLAERKNSYYVALINQLTRDALLPGALDTVHALLDMGIRTAIGSSSKNAPAILRQTGIARLFEAVADGNQIKHSKPDPEVFLLAASLLQLPAADCLVVEDADAGVVAGARAGMPVLAVGAVAGHPLADLSAPTLADIDLAAWIRDYNRK
ncbi:MAG: beta-phosphoglucomutase [Clostridiales bacterium]|nr:beta-phosphoglucomutase [Clostridiales bacterium]